MRSLFNCNLRAVSISAIALTIGLAACGGGGTQTTDRSAASDSSGSKAQLPKLALAQNVDVVGAGASFPAPLYNRWFNEISQQNRQLQVDYQSVGSGAGVERFTQQLVNFGASDVAMKDEEIAKIDRGVLMLPMTAGSIVLAYNLPGVETGLKLTRETYVDILLGEITKWNDPKIASANPGVNLPDTNITVVHRSDGSGTTGVFTQHLSAISSEWKDRVGSGKTVEWPTGIGGAKNDGVTAQINQTPGAIGYIEYGFAKTAGLNVAALENKEGSFIMPTDSSASQALAAVELPENLRAFISDPEGADSYPIVTYTWLLAYRQYDDPEVAKALEAVIEYALTEGQTISPQLGYIPLPQNVRVKVAEAADVISPDYDIEVN